MTPLLPLFALLTNLLQYCSIHLPTYILWTLSLIVPACTYNKYCVIYNYVYTYCNIYLKLKPSTASACRLV